MSVNSAWCWAMETGAGEGWVGGCGVNMLLRAPKENVRAAFRSLKPDGAGVVGAEGVGPPLEYAGCAWEESSCAASRDEEDGSVDEEL